MPGFAMSFSMRLRVEARDRRRVEPGERLAIAVALVEDRRPAQARPARLRGSGIRRTRGRRGRARPTRRRDRPCSAGLPSAHGQRAIVLVMGVAGRIRGRRLSTGGRADGNAMARGAWQNRRVIPWLGPRTPFPPLDAALDDPNGLLAATPDLTPERLRRRLPARHLPLVQRRSARALVEPGSADGALHRRLSRRALAAAGREAGALRDPRGLGVPRR